MRYEYEPSQHVELNINATCEVVINETSDVAITVDVEGDDADKVKVSYSSGTLTIKHEGASFGNITIGNISMSGGTTFVQGVSGNFSGTVISGNNIYMSGGSGSVFVNGKRIDLDESGKDYTPIQINVYVPSHITASLDASISGTGSLRSQVYLEEAFINSQGHTKVELTAGSIQAQVSGSGDLDARIHDGDLNVSISGSANVRVVGDMRSANVQVSGSGDVITQGICHGNYHASVSGSGDIRHVGTVKGRVRESVAGMGSVRVG
jgi:hypothetical protein